MSTDALETLGTLIGPNEKRDAIHLAVEPVIAGHDLRPGDDVRITSKGTACHGPNPVGIVDPFLKTPVKQGQRFWLVVYPRQITSLRHVWSHPAFKEEPSEPSEEDRIKIDEVENMLDGKLTAKQFMNQFALSINSTYDEVLAKAKDYAENGEYWNEGGRFESMSVPDEFWDHYEKITGEHPLDRGSFFSCAC